MIIPSIDLQNGAAVQLVGGEQLALNGGDPSLWADKFTIASEIAVIDLDSALGSGSNHSQVESLIKNNRCRVGGGIRSIANAVSFLDLGASKVIIGTKASPEFLMQLPKERVIAALDTRYGEVAIEGWKTLTNRRVEEKIAELKNYVGGFLITLIETEGSLKGIDIARCAELKKLCSDTPLTVAGGVNSVEEIAELDRLGIDVQVGMALYTEQFSYADAIIALLKTDRNDGLWPTVVVDERGTLLGLVYSSKESVQQAIKFRKGIYSSRTRGLWEKGTTSGNTQELLRIDLDCDRDSLKFTVRQNGKGFCHNGDYSCWGNENGLPKLFSSIESRKRITPHNSYTSQLLSDTKLLSSKLLEEASELIQASSRDEVIYEASDLLYFTLVKLVSENISLGEIYTELDRRSLTITRRGGGIKSIVTDKGAGG